MYKAPDPIPSTGGKEGRREGRRQGEKEGSWEASGAVSGGEGEAQKASLGRKSLRADWGVQDRLMDICSGDNWELQ